MAAVLPDTLQIFAGWVLSDFSEDLEDDGMLEQNQRTRRTCCSVRACSVACKRMVDTVSLAALYLAIGKQQDAKLLRLRLRIQAEDPAIVAEARRRIALREAAGV